MKQKLAADPLGWVFYGFVVDKNRPHVSWRLAGVPVADLHLDQIIHQVTPYCQDTQLGYVSLNIFVGGVGKEIERDLSCVGNVKSCSPGSYRPQRKA